MVTKQQANVELYQRFLQAMNAGDYTQVESTIDPSFQDHHPGFDIHSLEAYKVALQKARVALRIHCELEDIISAEDKVITRLKLIGKHVGNFMDIPPTGKDVTWTTIEIWRVANGKFVERWAQDDMSGLMKQLRSDADNIQLILRLVDIVNGRKYNEMDNLFAPSFEDRNPAWHVKSLDELKQIIASAHQALDMQITRNMIYAADGGKVGIHITFNGKHIGTFMGMPPTGKPLTWTSIEVYRLENNKIVERWVQADTTGLMRQLGVPLP
jgi:predicted ester cyclase